MRDIEGALRNIFHCRYIGESPPPFFDFEDAGLLAYYAVLLEELKRYGYQPDEQQFASICQKNFFNNSANMFQNLIDPILAMANDWATASIKYTPRWNVGRESILPLSYGAIDPDRLLYAEAVAWKTYTYDLARGLETVHSYGVEYARFVSKVIYGSWTSQSLGLTTVRQPRRG